MKQVTMVGIDLAKRSFQLHGARADGSVVFRVKVSRVKVLDLSFVPATMRGGDGSMRESSLLGPGPTGRIDGST